MNLLSSRQHIEDFKKSVVWQDMQAFLKDMIENIRGELETVDDLKTLHRMQGEIITLRRMLALPDVLILEIDSNKNKGGE